jgi:hypothetical protein
MEFVYLLQEREFIKTSESIYKIGKTTQTIEKRMNGYPKGSHLKTLRSVKDSDIIESILKYQFKINFIQRKDIGAEYFEGDIDEMLELFDDIVNKPNKYIYGHNKYEDGKNLNDNDENSSNNKDLDDNSDENKDLDDNSDENKDLDENSDENNDNTMEESNAELKIPEIFNQNNKTSLDDVYYLEGKSDITIKQIVKLLIQTCAYIINGGNMKFITKSFDNNNKIIYNKFNNLKPFNTVSFRIKNKNYKLSDVIIKYKSRFIYKKLTHEKYESDDELMEYVNNEIFNAYIKNNESENKMELKINTIDTPIQFIINILQSKFIIKKKLELIKWNNQKRLPIKIESNTLFKCFEHWLRKNKETYNQPDRKFNSILKQIGLNAKTIKINKAAMYGFVLNEIIIENEIRKFLKDPNFIFINDQE